MAMKDYINEILADIDASGIYVPNQQIEYLIWAHPLVMQNPNLPIKLDHSQLHKLNFECNYSTTYDRVVLKIDPDRVINSREFQYAALKNQAFHLLVNIENARVVSTEIANLSDELLSTIARVVSTEIAARSGELLSTIARVAMR